MTYRVEQWVRKITSPIRVITDQAVFNYKNGEYLYNNFKTDKPCIINSIRAENSEIIIELIQNDNINDMTWSYTDQSYF